jgi:integrase
MKAFPGASSYRDRHGRTRWRLRLGKRFIALPGDPSASEAFHAAYEAALTGQARPAATSVARHPSSAVPRSLRAAWAIARRGLKGKPETIHRQTAIAEAFLRAPVAAGSALAWGDAPVADLKRRHIKAILQERSETPHAARHVLGIIRKIVVAAMDEEWIEVDPTHRISYRPEHEGWRAWTIEEREAFERHWPVGTMPRAAYAIALWLGNRRADVATLRWDAIRPTGVMVFRQSKTGEAMEMPILDELWAAICTLPVRCETILSTTHGRPFSSKSLTGHVAIWTAKAGLPSGCTLHGLRKSLARDLADHGATAHQIMAALGHRTLQQAELYTREANRRRMADEGMAKVVKLKVRP